MADLTRHTNVSLSVSSISCYICRNKYILILSYLILIRDTSQLDLDRSLTSSLTQFIAYFKNKNKNIFISINNDLANLYIEENYTNVNIAIMVISIRVMIIKYNIQN